MKVFGTAHFQPLDGDAKCFRGIVEGHERTGPNGVIRIPHNGDACSRWDQLFEQFEILDLEHIRQNGDASYISTRPREAFDEFSPDRVSGDCYDGKGRRGTFAGECQRRRPGYEDVDLEPEELGNESVMIRILDDAAFENDVLAFGVAEIA